MFVGTLRFRHSSSLAWSIFALTLSCGARTGLDIPIDLTGGGRGNGDDGGADGLHVLPGTLPQLVAPLSTSRVTRRQPTLRWTLPPGVADATVDLCSDRACTRPIGSPAHVTGTSYVPASPLPSGVVFWRVHPSTNTAVSSPTWQLTVGVASAPVDSSWGTTLDVNGDGYADLAASAINPSTTETAFVYLGGPAGVATSPDTTLIVTDGIDHEFTGSVASAGDVNGDGYCDLVVGATGPAFAFVYLGGPSGLVTTAASTIASPVDLGDDFFVSVAGAGDVNGDGYGDVLVVALEDLPAHRGHGYLYLGGPTGVASTPATTLDGAGGSELWLAGTSAGDVNGDGYADVVIGSLDGSYAYAYLGGPAGLGTTPDTTLAGPAGTGFGHAVASAGDVNGDGYADVVVGAPGSSNAYLYLGGPEGLGTTPAVTLSGSHQFGAAVASAGDVNGDGFADVVVGAVGQSDAYVFLGSAATFATTPSAKLQGDPPSHLGASVSSAGDLNGDGYSDVVVGAPLEHDVIGSVYVYAGAASGVAASPTTTLSGGTGLDELYGSSVFGATN